PAPGGGPEDCGAPVQRPGAGAGLQRAYAGVTGPRDRQPLPGVDMKFFRSWITVIAKFFGIHFKT
ncbi:MAG: hypothetical protein ACK54K_00050, partial [Gemmatimonadaceae bacterium]